MSLHFKSQESAHADWLLQAQNDILVLPGGHGWIGWLGRYARRCNGSLGQRGCRGLCGRWLAPATTALATATIISAGVIGRIDRLWGIAASVTAGIYRRFGAVAGTGNADRHHLTLRTV